VEGEGDGEETNYKRGRKAATWNGDKRLVIFRGGGFLILTVARGESLSSVDVNRKQN